MTLKELVKEGNYITDKFNGHSYLDSYNELFSEKSIKNLLEIGVQSGGSLIVWRDYFTEADITGVDIDFSLLNIGIQERIKVIKADAYKKKFLKTFDTKFDIIIDDGSHWYEHMEFVVKNYVDLLTKNGIMVIEDIASKEWADKLLEAVPLELKKYTKLIDLRYINNRWDDILLVINKKDV